MRLLLAHLFNHHLLPVLLLPIAMAGFFFLSILGMPEALRSQSAPDRVIGACFAAFGLGGTIATSLLVRGIRRRDSSWRALELGRTAWTALISLAWCLGALCGAYLFCVASS